MEKSSALKRKTNILLICLLAFTVISSCTDTPSGGTDFKCIETSSTTGNLRSYIVTFYKTKNNTTDYLISNFHRIGDDGYNDITVTVKNNTITIPQQALGTSGLIIKSGSGTVDADFRNISISYNIVESNSTTTNYRAEYTR